MSPDQLRRLVIASIGRAANHLTRIEDAADEVLGLVARDTLADHDAAGDAILELVSDAIVFGLGAWAEGIASTLDGSAEDLDPTAIARTFLESYRALLVIWSALPLDVKVSDALQSARLDAQAGDHGYLEVDASGRLRRLDPQLLVDLLGPAGLEQLRRP